MNQSGKRIIYWTHFLHENWKLYIAATANGLCYVGSADGDYEELLVWVNAHIPNHQLVNDDFVMKPYTEQLKRYFHGQVKLFNVPIDFHGTDFQKKVWKTLINIPFGKTISYSDFAEKLGKPNAIRAAAAAIGKNPILIAVPCHRVISKSGALTGYRGGLPMKADLLALEETSRYDEPSQV